MWAWPHSSSARMWAKYSWPVKRMSSTRIQLQALLDEGVESTSLSIVKTKKCTSIYKLGLWNRLMNSNGWICAVEPGDGAYSGDSGSPLIVDNVQAGIVSVRINAADPIRIQGSTFTLLFIVNGSTNNLNSIDVVKRSRIKLSKFVFRQSSSSVCGHISHRTV